jgi:hypothetical protein
MAGKTCPSCGHENDETDRFCGQCAAALDAPAVAAPPMPAYREPTPAAPPMPAYREPTPGPSEAKPAGSPRRILFAGIAIAVIPAIAFIVFGGGSCTGTVEGELRVSDPPHGDFVLKPTSCFSGEHESFFGAWVTNDLTEIDGRSGFKGGLKLVKEHTGEWRAFLESPNECTNGFNCVIRPIDPAHCSVFDVDVSNTSTTVNDIRVREGHARLECSFPEGGTLRANLTFDGCS